jgi:hypothetical protein
VLWLKPRVTRLIKQQAAALQSAETKATTQEPVAETAAAE